MAEKKGLKLRRCAKNKPRYQAQFYRTEANKKRKLAKHVRQTPEDTQAREVLERLVGKSVVAGHVANQTARAKRRSAARAALSHIA